MGFSPLVIAVAIAWGRMTSLPGNGDSIMASHGGGRQGQKRFDLGNPLRIGSSVGNLGFLRCHLSFVFFNI